jgi:LmbE family N-acetylglucosaminyl deacetylase
MSSLIIAPHADDETLGCTGFLNKAIVLICSFDSQRIGELITASSNIGYTFILGEGKENNLDMSYMVGEVESWVNSFRPEMVFIPHSGYHQDHQVAYNASFAALRPHEKNFFVKKVLVYEGIHDFIWSDEKFIPNYFIPIDIEKKIEAFSYYKSQMKSHRSLDSIRQLAALRGKQSGYPYAEAYRIIRWCE